MKKSLLAILLALSLVLSGCSINITDSTNNRTSSQIDNQETKADVKPEYASLSNPELLTYVEDNVYQSMLDNIDTNKYFVENVEAIYISQEYIDELAYNSKENIFFGYTLSDLNKQFEGKKYVFNVTDRGETRVELFEEYDDTYNQMIRNVAIGTGVILLCVTVSVVTAGAGAPAVTMIFAGAAKTGTALALSSAAIGGTVSTAITYYQTDDMEESLKEGALEASEQFKWGAILGSVAGGSGTALALKGATMNGLTMNEAATIQKETKWSLDTIKQIKSMEEFNVYKKAGLTEKVLNGQKVLVRDIDLKFISELSDGTKVTNLQRMEKGLAPLDPATGKAYQLHHIGQKSEGTLAILTESEHQGNARILNTVGKETEINRQAFNKERKRLWQNFAKKVRGMV